MGQHPSSPIFLVTERHAAEVLLRNAEAQDEYLTACAAHAANAPSRRTYAANSIPPNLVNHYQDRIKALRLPRRLLDLPRIPIVTLMPSSDGGMPHSRPNMVCIPRLELLESTETMIHELWHVHQRIYQAEWTIVFKSLGWKPYEGELPAGLERYRRINPDTVDSPLWIFEDTWVPVPLFRDVGASLTEADVWFYHVKEGHRQRTVPPALAEAFPDLPASAYEHPRELAAYALSSPDQHGSSPGFMELISHLGHYAIA